MTHISEDSGSLQRYWARFKAMLTPRNKLIVRSFVVFVLTIVNIALIVVNVKRGENDNAIACGVTTCVLVPCLLLMLKVGYKTLAEKVREYEEGQGGGGDYLSAQQNNNTKRPTRSNSDGNESLATISDSNSPTNNGGIDFAARDYKYTITDDINHPANSCVFRRHPSLFIPLFLLGLLASVSAAIFYLVLAIEKGVAPTMSTLQDTFYMCFILYMVCGKWCMMIALLIAKLRAEGMRYRSGDLLRHEAMEKMAEEEKKQKKSDAGANAALLQAS